MTTTKTLDATTALWTVLDAALSVPVLDGPWQTEMQAPVYVVVGHNDDPDSNEATAAAEDPSNLSLGTRQEKGTVNCYIVAESGGTDMAALRTLAKATFDAAGAALAANPTLSGVVQRAEYGTDFLMKQEATDAGIGVRLLFTVAYTASV